MGTYRSLVVVLLVLPYGLPEPLSGRLSRDGATLKLNGKPYAGVGVNVVDLLWNNNTAALVDASARGIPFIRFAAAPYYGSDLQPWKVDAESYWRTLDIAVAMANKHRVRLVPDLLWNPFAFADFCGEPLSALFNGSVTTCTWRTASAYVQQAAARYHSDDAILFWELSNENNALVDGWLGNSTVACNPARGTPSHRTDADNFDTAQMINTHSALADIIRSQDPGRLVNAGNSMPRNVAESWRDTPRAQVKAHKINSSPDNKTAFVKNLLDVNEGMDFVSAHMGGVDDRAARPWLSANGPPTAGSTATALLDVSRVAAAAGTTTDVSTPKPFYLGEYTLTLNATTGARSYGYAEAVLDWVLDLDARFGGGAGVLTSLWVFEYAPQNKTWSLDPVRDGQLLSKIAAANTILQRYQHM